MGQYLHGTICIRRKMKHWNEVVNLQSRFFTVIRTRLVFPVGFLEDFRKLGIGRDLIKMISFLFNSGTCFVLLFFS